MPAKDKPYAFEELSPEMIPSRGSDMGELYSFGVNLFVSRLVAGDRVRLKQMRRWKEMCRRARTEPKPTLTELRVALFCKLRAWRFIGSPPPDEEIEYMWGLADKIRDRVEAGEFS